MYSFIRFDLTKVPDIYDMIRFDVLHNSHLEVRTYVPNDSWLVAHYNILLLLEALRQAA
jgi:hypothetical protein